MIYNRFHACFHALLLLDSVFLFKLCFKLELRKALFENSFRIKNEKEKKKTNFLSSIYVVHKLLTNNVISRIVAHT